MATENANAEARAASALASHSAYVVKTVKVKTDAADNEQGYYLLNESDFDPTKHTLYEETKQAATKKPSEGLKVDELKSALTAKGIAIPEGAKKEALAALLDAAPADA